MKYKVSIFALLIGLGVVGVGVVSAKVAAAPLTLSVSVSANKINIEQTVTLTAKASFNSKSKTAPSIIITVGGKKQTCKNASSCKLVAGPFKKTGDVKYVAEAKLKLSNGKEVSSVKKGVITVVAAGNIPVAVKTPAPITEKPAANNSGSSPVTNNTGNTDGANYTGPFPAPEGMVLTGTFGEDKFQEPTGNGTYRFKIQTAWKKNIACKDATRTVVGSKGKTWEEGFWKGGDLGTTAKGAIIVIYDDTPKGTKAGTALYNEGYKAGYAIGFAGKAPPYIYGCNVDEGFDISKYDNDGWVKQSVDKLPALNTLYMPAKGAALSNLDSVLGSKGVVFSFDAINDSINKSELNVGKSDLNISRMDFIEGQLDSAEAALTTAEFANAFYKQQKKVIENKYKGSCVVADATVAGETYGSNNFTNLSFITVCLDSGGGENKWTLSKYSFMKIPGDKMLMISFAAASDVKVKGADTTDSAKLPSKDFIAQLYSKIQVK